MKRIILCEGKTDAILISYFLIKRFGWSYTDKQVIRLPVARDNEMLNWYRHPEKRDGELAIWGVGGIDNLPARLGNVIERTQRERNPKNRFERIVLFFDRDRRNEEECANLIKEWATNCKLKLTDTLQLGKWADATTDLFGKSPPEIYQLSILAIVLPPDGKGNLETFLIDALKKHSDVDKHLSEKASAFIGNLPDEPYLSTQRLRPKACLGAILSVMSVDWAFSKVHERLTQVQWEDITSVLNAYQKLDEL